RRIEYAEYSPAINPRIVHIKRKIAGQWNDADFLRLGRLTPKSIHCDPTLCEERPSGRIDLRQCQNKMLTSQFGMPSLVGGKSTCGVDDGIYRQRNARLQRNGLIIA